MNKILIVTTNYSGCECNKADCKCIKDTGVWLEEFFTPYSVFIDAGVDIVIASLKGGLSPIDKNSMAQAKVEDIETATKLLNNTQKLSDIKLDDFDGMFIPGGHGPMFDLANSEELAKAIEYFYHSNKVISAVCHGPAGLINAKRENGKSILDGKRMTSFTNKEENMSGLSDLVPFLLETKLKELGAEFENGEPWQENVVVDEKLVTGQNPQSSKLLAEKVLEKLLA